MLNYRLINPPLQEPVSLALAKQQLRIDPTFTEEDLLIGAFITAARQYAEKYTARAFFPQTWELSLDHFPWWNWFGGTIPADVRENWPFWSAYVDVLSIKLPFPRALTVNSITYLDNTGAPQTVDPSTYSLDVDSEPARCYPVLNQSWPTQQSVLPGAIKVNYTAGSFVATIIDTATVTGGALVLSQGQNYLGLVSLLTTALGVPPTTVAGAVYRSSVENGVIASGSLVGLDAYDGQALAATYYVPQMEQTVVAAMMLMIGHLYKNREASVELALTKIPFGVDALLDTVKHHTFAI